MPILPIYHLFSGNQETAIERDSPGRPRFSYLSTGAEESGGDGLADGGDFHSQMTRTKPESIGTRMIICTYMNVVDFYGIHVCR